jgi:hypothetical protein
MDMVLGYVGYFSLLFAVIAGIWLLVVAFRTSIWWGLACLVIPIAGLVFVCVHWDKAWKPFLCSVSALIVGGVIGVAFSPRLGHQLQPPVSSTQQKLK